MIRSNVFSTRSLTHYIRLELGCYGCKHCYVSLEKENKHQKIEKLYMQCEIGKVNVGAGFTECSEFEQREEEGVWR